jgi:hypothetical protein
MFGRRAGFTRPRDLLGRRVGLGVILERRVEAVYSLPMNDAPHSTETPAEWLEALARSEAELAAGLTVPAETVHQRIRDAIARIESEKHARQAEDLG